jgi:hypothetical protein
MAGHDVARRDALWAPSRSTVAPGADTASARALGALSARYSCKAETGVEHGNDQDGRRLQIVAQEQETSAAAIST